jgi:6-bladed beta-propeller protein
MRPPQSRSIIAVLFILSACAEDTSRTATSTKSVVNGVERIQNRGQPPRWELRELVSLGSGAEGGGPQEFSFITGVIADAQHNIFVADQGAFEIRVFNEQGQLVRKFGREGGGPGEFRALQSVGWLGDTLVTMDFRNARLGLLTRAGEWIGQRAFAPISGSSVRLFQTGPAELYSLASVRSADRSLLAYVRQTLMGEADTVVIPRILDSPTSSVACSYQGAISFYSPSFAPSRKREPVSNATLLDYWTGEYRLHFLRVSDTVRIVERDLPRLPVANDEWSGEEAHFRAWRDSLPPDRSCQPAAPRRPEAKSLLRAVFFDDQNQFWVERRDGEGFAFDVFSGDGTLLAQMNAPARHPKVPVYVRGDRLYLVVTDSLDTQYVKAFRIVPSPR